MRSTAIVEHEGRKEREGMNRRRQMRASQLCGVVFAPFVVRLRGASIGGLDSVLAEVVIEHEGREEREGSEEFNCGGRLG